LICLRASSGVVRRQAHFFPWEKLEHYAGYSVMAAARVRTAMIVATDAVDTIATIILIAMMLVPLANIVTGAIVGTGLAGPAGGLVGIVAAITISRGSYTRHRVSPDPSARRAP